jgi:hypothetical protein
MRTLVAVLAFAFALEGAPIAGDECSPTLAGGVIEIAPISEYEALASGCVALPALVSSFQSTGDDFGLRFVDIISGDLTLQAFRSLATDVVDFGFDMELSARAMLIATANSNGPATVGITPLTGFIHDGNWHEAGLYRVSVLFGATQANLPFSPVSVAFDFEVPEPATSGIVAIGLAGLWLSARNRRSRRIRG